MAINTYSPREITVIVGAAIMQGFAEDTFVKCERSTALFTKVVGADGEVTRVYNPDQSGKITLTLKQTSNSNDVLSGLVVADRASLAGIFPILVKDHRGTTLVSGASAWIEKYPEVEYGSGLGTREWSLDVAELEMLVGGNS